MSRFAAPRADALMYETLFSSRPLETVLGDLSEGLLACASNSDRLLRDAKFLAEDRRFATATFLTTTASEEIAKAYILLDAARVDLTRHENVLRRLCRAFLDHVAKRAYYKIHEMGRIVSIDRLKDLWASETTRWWPGGDPEGGEPDMPHETFFTRELPLYVTFSDYSRSWLEPEDGAYRLNFEPMVLCSFSSVRSMYDKIIASRDVGLFSPTALAILNDIYCKQYVGPRTTDSDLERLRQKLAYEIERSLKVSEEVALNSPLAAWPLYHWVSESLRAT